MSTPNHYQRQIMQRLRGAGWVQAIALPSSPRTIAKLVSKGWIEKLQTPTGPAYRLTEAGLEAKQTPVRISKPKP
jgi:DNA-binding PadR family transcriptional regulator